jgi:hypothetical protein
MVATSVMDVLPRTVDLACRERCDGRPKALVVCAERRTSAATDPAISFGGGRVKPPLRAYDYSLRPRQRAQDVEWRYLR